MQAQKPIENVMTIKQFSKRFGIKQSKVMSAIRQGYINITMVVKCPGGKQRDENGHAFMILLNQENMYHLLKLEELGSGWKFRAWLEGSIQ